MLIAKEIATVLGWLSRGPTDWLRLKVLDIGGLGDFIFFRQILSFLRSRINDFGFDLMGRMMSILGVVALTVMTLYILIQGYRVMTGQLRESMMGLVANMAKAAFIVAFAVAFGTVGSQVHNYLTTDMKDGIHQLVTGSNTTPEEKIDESLGWLQVAMTTMDALDLQGDPALVSEKERAEFYVGLGTGGPAVVAGSLLLLYEIALALFVGLGPLFILCLLFDSTKSLFQRWLFYGIGTMFSMAVLSFMVSLALDMVTRVAIAAWTTAAAGQLLLGSNMSGGLNSMAMQQGGMGLILTTLILTAPPMAAMFFNGTLGSFAAYSTMGAHLGSPPPQRGAYSEGSGYQQGMYQPQQPPANQVGDRGDRVNPGDFTRTNTHAVAGTGGQPIQEGIKPETQAPYRDGNASRVSGGGETGYIPPQPGERGVQQVGNEGTRVTQTSGGGVPQSGTLQTGSGTTVQGSPPPSASPPPTRVVQNSPPAQPAGPTYTPPPPPKDTTPRGGGGTTSV